MLMRFLLLISLGLLITSCNSNSRHIPKEQAYCVKNFNPNPIEIEETKAEKIKTNDYSFLPMGTYSFVEAHLFYKWTAHDRVKSKMIKKTQTTPDNDIVDNIVIKNNTNDVMISLLATSKFLESYHKFQKAQKEAKENKDNEDSPLKVKKPLLAKSCFRGLLPNLGDITQSSQAITSFNISKDGKMDQVKLAEFKFKYFKSQFERSFNEVDNTKTIDEILSSYSDFQLFKIKKIKPEDDQFYELRSLQKSNDGETVQLSVKYKLKTLKKIE